MRLKPAQNQEGFTLIGTMVGIGMFTMAMSALASMMVTAAKAQRDVRSNSEITTLYERVRKTLDAEWSCTASLAGTDYLSPVTIKDPVAPAQIIAYEGLAEGKIWTLEKVRLEEVQPVPGQIGVYRGVLRLETKKNMKLSMGAPVVARNIAEIYFELGAPGTANAGMISRRHGPSGTLAAGQITCEMLGGTWDPTKPNGERCFLNSGKGKS